VTASPPRRRQITLRLHIATAFVALLAAAGITIVGYGYLATSRLLVSASEEASLQIAARTAGEAGALLSPGRLVAALLARHRLVEARTLTARLETAPFLIAALAEHRQLSAIYVGYGGGDFFLLRPLPDDAARHRMGAPDRAAFLVQSVAAADRPVPGRFLFLDAAGVVIASQPRPAYRFDPRTRDWYRQALASADPVRAAPYVFFTTHEVGTTIAQRSADRGAVAGVDITLRELSRSLGEHRLTPSARLALVDARGFVIAHPDVGRLVRAESADSVRLARLAEIGDPALGEVLDRGAGGGGSVTVSADGQAWLGAARPIRVDAGEALTLVFAAPRDELLADARRLAQRQVGIGFLVLALTVPLIWLLARRISRPLETLAHDARAIRGFEFADRPALASRIVEVDALDEAMAGMRQTIRQFLETSAALAAEDHLDRLLERVIEDTVRAAGAREGALYLADETGGGLTRGARHTTAGATSDGFPEHLEAGAAHACGRAASMPATTIERLTGPRPVTTLAVPLVSRRRELVGVLGLGLDHDLGPGPSGERNPRVAFVEALSSVAAVAIETRALLQAQKALLDSFIQVVAAAIDAKSPYTGGHCQRVPVLSGMIAEAASAASDGPFRDFALDEAGWETLHIASWLHDCGKVTTPEHVVDKAVKLETIYNRLHEVRMRFEVLKRDADLACWRAVAAGADEAAQRALRDQLQRTLDEEFAFVAECNVGGEVMSAARIERLRAIARRTWTRTLDDRVGLSDEERRRLAGVPAPPLPVEEPLLADRPEHVVPRRPEDRIPADNPWGFRLDVPELKLNLGEVYSLSIGRGTLTTEERYIINHHVVQTALMLARLPFPRHLRRVPEVAGAHHERADGKGYPRRLAKDETDVLARIIAIADVFEALTAADRPYKPAKPLSESLRIMADMSRGGHIDPDLFRLFIEADVPRRYAAAHLQPAQQDVTDPAAVLAS
jgi:HD-GYP domain-containing protein (c-di-GMP phosphodiesterase class II)